ncbi:MAG: galactose-1-phosphate uridylyltransferase, partial [Candidatus Izemoplasmataceae bacterium]
FTVSSIYGDIDITINLSKPEKDPKAIALALKEEKTNYPDCLLCKENVGYYGSLNHPARSNHRVIKLAINEEPFYLQYSPYVYYNEHAILLHEDHIPMEISIKTFKRLLDFIDLMPHYFMGSNAGLPIVGGSILNHEHYQGGNADFPIYHAAILNTYQKEDVKYELLKWPLSVIRLTSPDKAMLIKHAEHLRATWLAYENSAQGIKAYTNETPHNAITPIARKQQGHYIIDIALRNNRTSDDFPDGIFHPHQSHHHIKKENIGLIEVMGLAILPGRLDEDLQEIKAILLKDKTTFDNITPYKDWIETLKKLTFNPSHIDRFIEENVAKEFIEGLEDCGVFKQTETGLKHFNQFVKDLLACLPK